MTHQEDRHPMTTLTRLTDYDRGLRTRGSVAAEIDRRLARLLREDADREELWPLLYEYGAAYNEPDPNVGIQAFVDGNIVEAEQGQYRYVRFEECPTDSDERCGSEHHHYGRGDHVVPLDPDWTPA